jgi:magnesium-transporting ATPase (P-type)
MVAYHHGLRGHLILILALFTLACSKATFFSNTSPANTIKKLRGGHENSNIVPTLSQELSQEANSMINNPLVTPPLAMTSAHWMDVEDCLDSLQVQVEMGLSSLEAAQRIQEYGLNALQEPPKRTFLELLAEQFNDRLVQIMLLVAMISAFFASMEGHWQAYFEPGTILLILLLNACMGIYQSSSAESSLQALKSLQAQTATVLRDGQWIANLPSVYLVPGDIIALRVGDKVPADGRIVQLKSNAFTTEESSLTGMFIYIYLIYIYITLTIFYSYFISLFKKYFYLYYFFKR